MSRDSDVTTSRSAKNENDQIQKPNIPIDREFDEDQKIIKDYTLKINTLDARGRESLNYDVIIVTISQCNSYRYSQKILALTVTRNFIVFVRYWDNEVS